MKVLQINTFYKWGSTGRIAYDLMQVQEHNGIQSYIAYGTNMAGNSNNDLNNRVFLMQGWLRRKINILRTRLFDNHGFYNETETRKLLKWINEIKPDIIHLHNIHNHYINVRMLFNYIKEEEIPVVWTLHDCWPFTGHCSHFDYEGCNKWKTLCHDCTLLKEYPPTWFWDFSSRNYIEKRTTFSGVKTLTLVTPSKWLSNLTRDSFIKEYPVKVINNGVNTDIFKPHPSNLAKEHIGVNGKKVLLAMATGLGERKGGYFLRKLASKLNFDEILVLVGKGAKKHASLNPTRCVGIDFITNMQELAKYYSAADVFINPTLEDNFPTTNIEAMACGTPVITFDTGGSIESVLDGEIITEKEGIRHTSVGAVVPKGNLELMLRAARIIMEEDKDMYVLACRNKAIEKYDKNRQFEKYIDLYKEIMCK